ncbi:MAG: aminomethyl-transferring glycine dehydrogenase subunit GcvPA [Acidilobus sp.]
MEHPWIPNSGPAIKAEMLKVIDVSTPDDLYSDIPREVFLDEDRWSSLQIGAGRPLSEVEVSRRLELLLSNVKRLKAPPFAGGGLWPHYVPPAVRSIVERGEFLTAYTPYQPEISQGLLQALFEYQSLMADLLAMDVVNASMYDWGSSLGEASLLAVRVRGIRRILVPLTINPFHLEVLETYAWAQGIEVERYTVDLETGYTDLEDLKTKLDRKASAVYLEYPSTFTGVVDINARAIGEAAHDKGSLFIVGVNPIAMGLYKPPGELGADVAVGDGQPLGLGLNLGGTTLGILGVRWDGELVKQMPGRLIGMTFDSQGRRSFTMILQTREQHIRRSKATSNITTNAALNAIAAAVYMSLLGRRGLRELAEAIWYRAHYAADRLSKIACVTSPALGGEFFGDFVVSLPTDYEGLWRRALEEGYMAGIPLGRYVKWALKEWGLLSFTEVHSKEDIDSLVAVFNKVIKG